MIDRTWMLRIGLMAGVLLTAACEQKPAPLSHQAFINIARDLSTDAMAGRAPGTVGSAAARAYLLDAIETMGLAPFAVEPGSEIGHAPLAASYLHAFPRSTTLESREVMQLADGVNLLFLLPGGRDDAGTIVVTAHYDHLGVVDGEIYNGADDNASGVAGLLAIAEHFRDSPPDNRIIFALLDAEEGGKDGARAFVKDYAAVVSIDLNINLDMISRSETNELYLAGTYHQPRWVPFFEDLARGVPVNLLLGHDDPSMGETQDWTQASDHFAFHERGIPFVYFGVEDHPDYHQPTDTFDRIPQDFFAKSIETVVIAAESIDASLDQLIMLKD